MHPINSFNFCGVSRAQEEGFEAIYQGVFQGFPKEAFQVMDPWSYGRAVYNMDRADWRNGIASISAMLLGFSEFLSYQLQVPVVLEPFYEPIRKLEAQVCCRSNKGD